MGVVVIGNGLVGKGEAGFAHGGPHEVNDLGGIDRAPKVQVNVNAVTAVCIVPMLILIGLGIIDQILRRRSGIFRRGLPWLT